MKALKDTLFRLVRFWKGPCLCKWRQHRPFSGMLDQPYRFYIPHSLLKEGHNRIIIFETEGKYEESINLVNQPTFKTIKGENL